MALAKVQWGDSGGTYISSSSAGTVLPGNSTPGNSVLLSLYVDSPTIGDIPSSGAISSSIASTWTRVTDCAYLGSDFEHWIGTVTGAATTVTVTPTGAVNWAGQGLEVSGGIASSSSGGNNGADTTNPTITVSPVVAGDMVVVLMAGGDVPTAGPGGSWVEYDAGFFAWSNGLDVVEQVVPSGTSVTATWTAGLQNFGCLATILVPSSSGGSASPLAAVGTGVGIGPQGFSNPLAVVQQGDTGSLINSGSSGTVLTSNATIGHTIALAVQSASGTANDVKTPVGICSTWTRISGVSGSSLFGDNEWWVGTVTSATKTVTITTNSGDQWTAQGTEVSGAVGSAISGGSAYGSGSVFGLTVSSLVTGDMVFVLCSANENFNAGNPTSPWVIYNTGGDNLWSLQNGLGTAYQVTSASSVTATWDADTSGSWIWGAVGLILAGPSGINIHPAAAVGSGAGVGLALSSIYPLAAVGTGVGGGTMRAAGMPPTAQGVSVSFAPTVSVPTVTGALVHPTGFPLLAEGDTFDMPAASAYTMPHSYFAIGDIAILGVICTSVTSVVSTITGSSTGTWVLGPRLTDSANALTVDIWTAPVIAVTTADALTITWAGGSAPGYGDFWGDSLSAGYGVNTIWTIVASGKQPNGASTTLLYPSLTTSATVSLQGYWGIAVSGNLALGGSTTGFTYIDCLENNGGNEQVYALGLNTSTTYAPTSTQNYAVDSDAVAIILMATSSGSTVTPPPPPPPTSEPWVFPHPLVTFQASPRASFR